MAPFEESGGLGTQSTKRQSAILAESLSTSTGSSRRNISVSVTHSSEKWQNKSLVLTFKVPTGSLDKLNQDKSVVGTDEKILSPTDPTRPGLPATIGGHPAGATTASEPSAPATFGTR